MEERRRDLRLAAAALGLSLAGAAGACELPLRGTQLESPQFSLVFRTEEKIAVAKHFKLEVAACSKAGGRAPESLRVDATMPEHRHGMNYAPSVKKLGPGRWQADGLMLHMPGRWEFVFVLDGERLTSPLSVSFVEFNAAEKTAVLRHGPWPPPFRPDPSNRVSGRPEAVALGERLFFEPRLSGPGSVLCATCHAPGNAFQDGKPRAFGLAQVDRNTPSLFNVRTAHWFGWDGAQDSLWAQSVRPFLDPKEMNASAKHVADTVRKLFAADYEKTFMEKPADDETVLVNVGKALAAYQETMMTGRTPFDDFRDALEKGKATDGYPAAAQRGLKIFVGKGNCAVCHFGPNFTNGEFADTGIRFFVEKGRVDSGRLDGINKLKISSLNLLGKHNDDSARTTATGTRHVQAQHKNFGEFRVPTLRNVANTAPYMHNGSLATLQDVVKHYSDLNEERLHQDGERILKPLRLTEAESADLVAFLESLSAK